jgi:hypothetical protein
MLKVRTVYVRHFFSAANVSLNCIFLRFKFDSLYKSIWNEDKFRPTCKLQETCYYIQPAVH